MVNAASLKGVSKVVSSQKSDDKCTQRRFWPPNQNSFAFISSKNHPGSRLETLILLKKVVINAPKGVLQRVSKEENTAKVRSDTRLSQKHIYVEMINAKLFWNAFTMCPRKKKNPETMDKSCGMCYYYHIYFMKYD